MSQSSDTQELDLSQPQDLELFVESAADVCVAAMHYESTAEADQYQRVSISDVSGEEIFTTLYQKLEHLEAIVANHQRTKEVLTDQQVIQLQQLYNDMLLLRDHIITSYKDQKLKTKPPIALDDRTSAKTTRVSRAGTESPAIAPKSTQSPSGQSVAASTTRPLSFTPASIRQPGVMPLSKPTPTPSTPGGITQQKAHSLREVLLVARDKDVRFLHDQRKQIAVDKLIRALAVVPKEGIPPAEAAPLFQLLVQVGVLEQPHARVQDSNNASSPDKVQESTDVVVPKLQKKPVQKISDTLPQPKETRQDVKTQRTPVKRVDTRQLSAASNAPKQKKKAWPSKRTLTGRYLNGRRERGFIATQYTKPEAFESVLQHIIQKIEGKTQDRFEKWLGEESSSSFGFLEKKRIAEVLELTQNPQTREILRERNIKYETFVTWVDLIDDMQLVAKMSNNRLFGELFVRWVVLLEMAAHDRVSEDE